MKILAVTMALVLVAPACGGGSDSTELEALEVQATTVPPTSTTSTAVAIDDWKIEAAREPCESLQAVHNGMMMGVQFGELMGSGSVTASEIIEFLDLLAETMSANYLQAVAEILVLDTEFIGPRAEELEAFNDRIIDSTDIIFVLAEVAWLDGVTAELADWCGSRNYHIVRSCTDGVVQESRADVLVEEKSC